MRKRICIVDGQGGGIGATLIKYLKEAFNENYELIALGTNAIEHQGGEHGIAHEPVRLHDPDGWLANLLPNP